jgi:sugar O-acyltransferase (sialic acid O-acetyltransferase NeuD family)
MYLFGAGGHAKVIIDILQSSGIVLSGLFDDNSELTELNGCNIIGKYTGQSLNELLIISIGNNSIRAKIASQLICSFGNAIHESVIISPSATIGEGTVIMHGAIVQASTIVGAHVIINTKASVDHDCTIGDYVHVSPGAVICGHVQVGEGTLIGAGSVVIPGINIGKWCKVGAGSVITQNLPDFATVVSRNCETK